MYQYDNLTKRSKTFCTAKWAKIHLHFDPNAANARIAPIYTSNTIQFHTV